MPVSTPALMAGTTAQRLGSSKVLGLGDLFLDTDTGRYGYGNGSSAASDLPHIKGTVYDRGESFVAKLDAKSGRAVACTLSDSTGDNVVSTGRWPRALMTALAADNAAAYVERSDAWNDTSKVYANSQTVVQAGTSPGTVGVKGRDDFSTTAADLIGATATLGGTWFGSATNSAGDFSINSAGLLRSSDAATSAQLLDTGTPGDREVSLGPIQNLITTATGVAANIRLYLKFVDSSNNAYVYVNQSTTGVISWGVTKNIGGVSTSTSGVGAILTSNSGSAQSLNLMKVAIVGLNVTGTIIDSTGTTRTAVVTLTSGEASTLAPATRGGFSSGGLSGWTIPKGGSNGYSDNVTAAAAPLLQIVSYNGAITGSVLTAQTNQLTVMCPEPPDVVFINSVHNYGSDTAITYLAKLDAAINKVLVTWPNAGIVVMSQNPEKTPGTNPISHLIRNLALSSYCRTKGVGYVPVIEAFRSLGDLGVSLVRSDGVHPTDSSDTANAAPGTAATNGAQLWTRVVYQWLKSQSKISAPTTP